MGGGYEVRSGCKNPICKNAFTARKAKLSEIEKDGTKLYPWYVSKYEE